MKKISNFLMVLFFSIGAMNAQDGAGKIALEGNRLFIVVPNYGFSIYDVSQATRPKEIRFVECPGILDIAVRNEYIYVNRFKDLYLLKVPRDPKQPDEIVHYQLDVFPSRTSPVTPRIEVMYFPSFDTFKKDLDAQNIPAGSMPMLSKNGSMSSLALAGDYIYAVDGNRLGVYLAKPTDENVLEEVKLLPISGGILETCWTTGDDRLYIGSQNAVHIIDISNRANPVKISTYNHDFGCDPVVVKGNFAYSTLRRGSKCNANAPNQLQVIDISNPKEPKPAGDDYDLTNPYGLDIEGNTLVVCDGTDGFRVFDISNPYELQEIAHPQGLVTYDILFHGNNKIAYLSTPQFLHIYSLQNPKQPASQSIINLPAIR